MSPSRGSSKPGWQRWLRRGLAAIGGLAVVSIFVLACIYGWLMTRAGQAAIEAWAETVVSGSLLEGELDLTGLSTDLLSEVSVDSLVLRDGNAQDVVIARNIQIKATPWALLLGELRITTVELTHAEVELGLDQDGRLSVLKMFSSGEPVDDVDEAEEVPFDVALERVDVCNIDVRYESAPGEWMEVRELCARLKASYRSGRLSLEDVDIDGVLARPDVGTIAVDGELVWNAGVERSQLAMVLGESTVTVAGEAMLGEGVADLTVVAEPLILDDIDRFLSIGLTGRLVAQAGITGPEGSRRMAAYLKKQGEEENLVSLNGDLDLQPMKWDGQVSVSVEDVSDWLTTLPSSLPVSGEVGLTLAPPKGDDQALVEIALSEGRTRFMDVEVDALKADVGLREKRLVVEGLQVMGPFGEVSGLGALALESGILELDVVGRGLRPEALGGLFVPAELTGSNVGFSGRVVVETYEPEVSVSVKGDLEAGPVLWTDAVRAERVVGPVTVDVEGTGVRVEATGTAERISAYGTVSPRASSDVVVRVDDGGVVVSGVMTATAVDYPLVDGDGFDLGVRGVRATWAVDAPLEGPLSVDVDGTFVRSDLLHWDGQSGRFDVRLLGSALDMGIEAYRSDGRSLAFAEASLNLDTSELQLDGVQLAPSPERVWEGSGRMRLTDTGFEDLDVNLTDGFAVIGANGAYEGESGMALSAQLYGLQASAAGDFVSFLPDELDGMLGGQIGLSGPSDGMEISSEFEFTDVSWVDSDGTVMTEGLGAQLQVGLVDGEFSVVGDLTVYGSLLATMNAVVPADLDSEGLHIRDDQLMRGDLDIDPSGVSLLASMQGLALPISSSIGGRLTLTNTLAEARVDGRIFADWPLVEGDAPVVASVQFLKQADGGVSWRGGVVQDGRKLVSLDGSGQSELNEGIRSILGNTDGPRIDWGAGKTYLSGIRSAVNVEGLPAEMFARIVGVPLDLQGDIVGRIDVGGSVLRPRLRADLTWENGEVGPVTVSGARVALTPKTGGYVIEASADLLHMEEQGGLYIGGELPVVIDFGQELESWSKGDMEVSVDLDLPFASVVAFDSGIRDPTGMVEIDGLLTGEIWDPGGGITVRTDGAVGWVYRPLGLRFRGLQTELVVTDHSVDLNRFAVRTSPSRVRVDTALSSVISSAGNTEAGVIRGQGKAAIVDGGIQDLDVSVQLDQAMLSATSTSWLRASTDGPLRITQSVMKPKIRGAVVLDESNIFLDYAKATGGGVARVDERITIVRSDGIERSVDEEQTSFDQIDLNVSVDVRRGSQFRLIMPIEAVQWLGSSAEALTRVDLRTRLQSEAPIRVSVEPCTEGRPLEGCGVYHPQVVGEIQITDGIARVLRAEFALSDSSIRFLGNEVYNPNLSIHGEMDTADGLVEMNIGGTAYTPEVEFVSANNEQVFAILALGRSLDGLTAEQVAGAIAVTLVNMALTDVNLPSIHVDPINGKIQVGLALSRSAFVKLSAGVAPSFDENFFDTTVEYTVARGLLLSLGFGHAAVPFNGGILLQRTFD